MSVCGVALLKAIDYGRQLYMKCNFQFNKSAQVTGRKAARCRGSLWCHLVWDCESLRRHGQQSASMWRAVDPRRARRHVKMTMLVLVEAERRLCDIERAVVQHARRC